MGTFFSRRTLAILSAALAFAAAGCSSTDNRNEVAGIANGEEIKVQEVREFLGIRGGLTPAADVPAEKKKEALDRLIGGRLLAQDARARGLDNTEEFRAQLKANESDIWITALFRKEMESRIKISDKEIKDEAKKLAESDKKLTEKEAEAHAGRMVYDSRVKKVQEELVAAAKKEVPSSVDNAILDRIGKKESVPDNAVVASAGPESITYGEVKKILQAMVGGPHGMEDLARNRMAIERVLEGELAKRSLVGLAKKQGIEGSKWLTDVRRDMERILLINVLAEKEILKGIEVTEKDIEATYREHSDKFVQDGKKIPLARIKEQIRGFVATNKKRKALEAYVEALKGKAKITVNEAVLAKV